jgi:hypothetical protein
MEVSGVHGRPARPGRQAISPATVAPPRPSLTSGRRPHVSARRPSAGRPARRVQRLPRERRPAREKPNPLLHGRPERWEAARRFGDQPDRVGVSVVARGRRDRPEGWGTARPGRARHGRVPVGGRRRPRGARRDRWRKDGSARGSADPARMPTGPPLGDRSRRRGRRRHRGPVRRRVSVLVRLPGPPRVPGRRRVRAPLRALAPASGLPRGPGGQGGTAGLLRASEVRGGLANRLVRRSAQEPGGLGSRRSSWTRRPARPGITGKG